MKAVSEMIMVIHAAHTTSPLLTPQQSEGKCQITRGLIESEKENHPT